jgi:hypothetical protein
LTLGSLVLVADTVRKVPTSLLIAVAVALLGLGGIWWVRGAPPATAARNSAPIDSVVTVRLDDGRLLTYQTGQTSDQLPGRLFESANPRRYCRRSAAEYPSMRVVGQDAPPIFLTRCG